MPWFFFRRILVVTWTWLIILVKNISGEFLEYLRLSSALSLFLCVLGFWISSTISWVTLLLGGGIYWIMFLEYFVKDLCYLMVNIINFFSCGVTTLILCGSFLLDIFNHWHFYKTQFYLNKADAPPCLVINWWMI